MPTFLFIWKEKVVDQLRGADPSALENMICKWAKIADTEQKVVSSVFQIACFILNLAKKRSKTYENFL